MCPKSADGVLNGTDSDRCFVRCLKVSRDFCMRIAARLLRHGVTLQSHTTHKTNKHIECLHVVFTRRLRALVDPNHLLYE